MTWNQVAADLEKIRTEFPNAIIWGPGADPRSPPYRIRLSAARVHIAEDLHARYGGEVQLTVGALRFPEGVLDRPVHLPPKDIEEAADTLVEVALLGQARVASGEDLLQGLVITNRTAENQYLSKVRLDAWVYTVDLKTPVATRMGPRTLMLERVTLPSHEPVELTTLIGTSCVQPEFGYSLEPGPWAFRVILPLGDLTLTATPMTALISKPFPLEVV